MKRPAFRPKTVMERCTAFIVGQTARFQAMVQSIPNGKALIPVGAIGLMLAAVTVTLVERPTLKPEPENAPPALQAMPPYQKPAPKTPEMRVPTAPVEPLVAGETGFGASLGTDVSIAGLRQRFHRFNRRLPDLFSQLDPLLRFSEQPDDLTATLVVGPFTDAESVENFCRTVRLQLASPCEPAGYRGDTLPVASR